VYIGPDRIDIYDVLRAPYQTLASYKRMLTDKSSYEAQHPAVFEPDRIGFTNGVLQTRRSSGAAFYEMFVHPAMFAHRNPKHIAVVGFGDGAIFREVLKHKNVESVVLLDYEEALLDLTLKHFPEYNDCSFLGSGNENCLEDPRVTMYYGDVTEWFAGDKDAKTDFAFDVIILDEE
jgi:spermidine synthase